jgi:hypothetical protein
MPRIVIMAVDGSRSVIPVALVAHPNLHHPAHVAAPSQSDVLYLCVWPSDTNTSCPSRGNSQSQLFSTRAPDLLTG